MITEFGLKNFYIIKLFELFGSIQTNIEFFLSNKYYSNKIYKNTNKKCIRMYSNRYSFEYLTKNANTN